MYYHRVEVVLRYIACWCIIDFINLSIKFFIDVFSGGWTLFQELLKRSAHFKLKWKPLYIWVEYFMNILLYIKGHEQQLGQNGHGPHLEENRAI